MEARLSPTSAHQPLSMTRPIAGDGRPQAHLITLRHPARPIGRPRVARR
jgi:hypothetical protein